MPHDHTSGPDWPPLEALPPLCRAHAGLPDLYPGEFMYMGRFEDPGQPPIVLYRHTLTRRYLNVDHAGHAYRYTPGPVGERHQPIRDLGSALAWVQGATTAHTTPTCRPPLTL